MISFAYDPQRDKKYMKEFLETLPYILPCKFCRSSLTQYYKELPFELDSRESFSLWFYRIHGKVNQKLRSQGQQIPPDPPFSTVKSIYTERLQYGCTKTDFPGWEFLFSLVENHPLFETSSPIPNAPPLETLKDSDDSELIYWNYISPQKRYKALCHFWSLLPHILPFSEWRNAWKKYSKQCIISGKSKSKALKYLYKVRCSIEKELDLLNRTTFQYLCNDLRLHRSGCSKSRNARTCRAIRKTRKQRR